MTTKGQLIKYSFPACRPALVAFLFAFMLLLLHACLLPETTAAAPPEATRSTKKQQPGVLLFFSGNQGLNDDFLRKTAAEELLLFTTQPDAIHADDAAFKMESAYRREGYPFASVSYSLTEDAVATMVHFTVNEGTRVTIRTLTINGNATFSNSELFDLYPGITVEALQSGTQPFIEAALQTFVKTVRSQYYNAGFNDAEIDKPILSFSENKQEVTITVTIREGRRFKITGIRFAGDILEKNLPLLRELESEVIGNPAVPRWRFIVQSRIREIYGEQGYPEVEVDLSEVQSPDSADIIFEALITSGPQVVISSIELPEGLKTKPSFIMNRIKLNSGDLYTISAERESFEALYRTGLFEKINFSLLGETSSPKRSILVELDEIPSKEYSFEIGWGSYEQLRSAVEFQEKNIWGSGRKLTTTGNISLKSEKLQVNLTDPWWFNSNFSANIPFYYQRRIEPGFTRQEIGTSLTISRKISKNLTAAAAYQFRATNILEVDTLLLAEAPETDYNLASVKLQATFDSRDDLFLPTAGSRYSLGFEMADQLLGSEIAFYRLTAGWRHFLSLRPTITLAMRIDTGIIILGRDQESLPLAERFFNGGENSVRSFSESELGPRDLTGTPAGGMAYNTFNLELRKRFSEKIAGSIFVDFGNVAPNQSRAETGGSALPSSSQLLDATWREYFQDLKTGLGVGCQYLLPLGPARLDIAFNPSPETDDQTYVVHFSIGMAF